MTQAKAAPQTDAFESRWERQYAQILELRRRSADIDAWVYSPMKLRLADNTFYTPDFMVVRFDGVIEFHEVKGFWRDDARVKIKVAAKLFPWFKFRAISKIKGLAYEQEEF